MDPFTIASIVTTIGTTVFSAIESRRQEKAAKDKEDEARREMNKLKSQYENLDTSNPFLNMENVMEDLTINQKQAEFQKQQFQQSQANILESFRESAGSSGIAALAQSLSRQGQIAAQKSAASIGAQEAANERARAQMASQIQNMERQGDVYSRSLERERISTLLGMSQQETAAYAQQAGMARQQMMESISSGAQNTASMFAGFGDGEERPDVQGRQQIYNTTTGEPLVSYDPYTGKKLT
tara:strand:+ start:12149 stop:12868 length:720 start_codon:yes stop_codon:yes gene_type:complete